MDLRKKRRHCTDVLELNLRYHIVNVIFPDHAHRASTVENNEYIVLFYMFREGRAFYLALIQLSPMKDRYEHLFAERIKHLRRHGIIIWPAHYGLADGDAANLRARFRTYVFTMNTQSISSRMSQLTRIRCRRRRVHVITCHPLRQISTAVVRG